MKRLLLSLPLLLASCAPFAVPTPVAPLPSADPTPAVLALKTEPGQSYATLRFDAGERAADNIKVTVSGKGLSVNELRCLPTGPQLVCYLGSRPPNTSVTLFIQGAASAQASYVRPDGLTYTLNAP